MLKYLPIAFIVFASVSVTAEAKDVRFNRDIRPILSDKCFACHGPDAEHVAADLRLDVYDEAADSGAIVPGDPNESELVARILSDDDDQVMPPPETHKPVTAEERDLLVRWIEQGAPYEPHWAYAPMQQAPSDLKSNLVDHFIDAGMKERGVEPVGPADRVTLIRRLSLDLTGIPPSTRQVDAFVSDSSGDAVPQLVDRMLDSPRYGERMAAYWLDLVRYADTVGYHGDQNVSQWAYRDYVIESFNENRPYDQFIREQLAGDLLPDSTTDQLIASGYNRLNQTTEEGGAQAKEYLAIYFADRVRNASQVFLGSTIGCAQCHDHKYDPFTAKDFYSFGAFFADLDERGVYGGRGTRPPVLPLPSDQQRQQINDLKEAIVNAESDRTSLREKLLSDIDDWDPPASVEFKWINDEQHQGRQYSGDWDFVSKDDSPAKFGNLSRRQQGDGLIQHFFTGAKDPITVTNQTQVYAWVYLDPKNPPTAIMLQCHDGKDWSHRAVWGSDEIVYGRKDNNWAGYHRMGELPKTGEWIRLEVDVANIGFAISDGRKGNVSAPKISGMAFTQFGGQVWWDQAGWFDSIPQTVRTALETARADRTDEQTKILTDSFLASSEPFAEINQRIGSLKASLKQIEDSVPSTVISRAVEPRTVRILARGDWMDDSGEVVEPAIPEFLGKLETGDQRATRLDLANWLVQPDNPLTARTMVNRLWGLMFGRGICTSVDDFGGQGTYPSNPDLLDALATELVASGWDIKHVMRLIANSETYQRSSKPSPELRQEDAYNDLFARQGRFRVDGEMVRDTVLSVSGLLNERVGGPSARPYQPAGYYGQLNFPKRTYQSDAGPDQYRRGIYTHWQRTFLHPMLKAFDAPSREECTAKRARSSTPIQALTLLNDPTFVEAARVFASRIIREGGETPVDRMVWAYRRTLSRTPEPEVSSTLLEIYDRHFSAYQDDPDAAKRLLSVGQSPTPDGLDPIELAAWTSVARTILNLHETTTRY